MCDGNYWIILNHCIKFPLLKVLQSFNYNVLSLSEVVVCHALVPMGWSRPPLGHGSDILVDYHICMALKIALLLPFVERVSVCWSPGRYVDYTVYFLSWWILPYSLALNQTGLYHKVFSPARYLPRILSHAYFILVLLVTAALGSSI